MNTERTILVFGATGQVGYELVRTLEGLGRIVAPSRLVVSLDKPAIIRSYIAEVRPSIIVNAAAYTAVELAESEQATARIINAEAPAVLAECANRVDAALIHYSTDYVFDGMRSLSDGGYKENDRTNPLNVYGETKLAGEHAIVETAKRYLVFRTSWIYSSRGKNFLMTMLRLARQKRELSIVADQVGAPTWSRTIATITAHVLAQELALRGAAEEWWSLNRGIYHLTSAGSATWAEFAAEIFLQAIPNIAQRPVVRPIPASQYSSKVSRPSNSMLSGEKLNYTFGLRAGHWRIALSACLQEISFDCV